MVLYDPGVGTLNDGQLFKGWTTVANYTETTKALTIDDVRDEVKTLLQKEGEEAVTEGQTVTYYPMIFNVRYVSLFDELGSTIRVDSVIYKAGTTKTYTVNEPYSPYTTDARFDGWIEAELNDETGKYAEKEGGHVYQIGDTITFNDSSEDVYLIADVPDGHWLIFVENGKGASYTSPQFRELEQETEEPDDPTRFGYKFDGWYTGAPEEAGGDPTGTKFTFGNTLSVTTRLYAKWTPEDTSRYTVLIWLQNLQGDDYDYKAAITVNNAAVGSTPAVSQQGTGDNAVARINGTNYTYDGFHLKEFDTGVTVVPEGTAVVNVYYDRTEYTLTFEVPAGSVVTGTSGTQYGVVGGELVRVYHSNSYGGYWYYYRGNQTVVFNGTRFNSNLWKTIKTITEKYDVSISSNFPIVGTDGITYNNGDRWLATNGSTYSHDDVLVNIEQMPAESITFRWSDPENRTLKIMNYYVESLEGETGDTTYQGTNYDLYKTISARYWKVTESEDFFPILGFTKQKSNPSFVNGEALNDSDNPIESQTINMYYTRDKYNINYMDGVYEDAEGVDQDEANRGQLKTEELYYDADMSTYNKDQDNYYSPQFEGYVFAGWYYDEACENEATFKRMPIGGITVYAKWIKKQYRVFLHPNVPTSETNFASDDGEQGVVSDDDAYGMAYQATSFRIDYGESINAVNPKRSEYELIGWYTDSGLTKSFNFDAFVANDSYTSEPNKILIPYDQTQSTETDDWGNATANTNSDAVNNRFWITHKLDLYAKWRSKLTGAKGIKVQYYAVEEADGKTYAGHFSDGTDLFTDPVAYYNDNSSSVGQGASTIDDATMEFKYWVLQTWDAAKGEYVDTATTVLPGATFTVLKANAKEESIGTEGEDEYYLAYTVRLRAHYGSIEAPTPTHINWYQNDQNPSALLHEDKNLQINQAVDIYTLTDGNIIPTRTGYKFLGWAREAEYDLDADNKPVGEKITYYDVTANDLYLKWVDDHYETIEGDRVTQVAADERMPYHAMYAVWEEQYFYVYHSSDGTVEKISLGGVETYNITSKVKGDYIYGGYYKDYAKKGSYDIANPAEYTSAVSGSKAYVGGLGYWKAANAYTENGTAMKPEANMTYFLKEVPAGFLASKLYVIYDAHNDNTVVQNYLISDVDDNNYNEVSLYAKDISTGDRIKLAASYTINDTYNNKTDKITAKTTFGMQAGYVAVWKPDLATADFEFAAGFTTPDGVDVEGAYIRMVTVGDGKYKGNFNSGNGGFAIVDVENDRIITPGQIVG